MQCRQILPAMFLSLSLMSCAAKPPASNPAPQPDIVRPPCTPDGKLMAPPAKLPALPDKMSQSEAMNAWVDDMTAYQNLRLQTGSLQDFIKTSCQ